MTGDRAIRWGTAGAVLLVAAIAAVVSFVHIQHLAETHGQVALASALLPVSIDGTVGAASLVMLRAARAGLGTPWLARGMLAATMACNVGYGLPFGLAGAPLAPRDSGRDPDRVRRLRRHLRQGTANDVSAQDGLRRP